MDQEQRLREYETNLIGQLRKEAYDVKDCFTKYTFQGLALVTGFQGAVFSLAEHDPYVGLLGIPLAIFLLTIASIGTHKYATANRLTGYQLHLERVRRFSVSGVPGWNNRMRDIGWEEALRAWRIVQTTAFEYLFVYGDISATPGTWVEIKRKWRRVLEPLLFWRVDKLRKNLIDSSNTKVPTPTERWFETRSHLEVGMAYYHGGYLKTMLSVLKASTYLSLLFIVSTPVRLHLADRTSESCVTAILAFLVTYYAFGRLYRIASRRYLIEDSFLSINACAVLWQVTICAHFATIAKLRRQSEHEKFLNYYNYSRTLGQEAIVFANHIFDIYKWHAAQSNPSVDNLPPLYSEDGKRVV